VQIVAPQLVPSVSRVHASESVDVAPTHAPLVHVNVVRLRVRVPLSAQASANPPHAPQSPRMGGPQSTSPTQPVQTFAASSHTAEPLHGLPGVVHAPALQTSAPLQNAPSSHDAVFGAFTQPLAPHVSSVHALPSSQPAATHAPLQQV
jgi:hypothetical protein